MYVVSFGRQFFEHPPPKIDTIRLRIKEDDDDNDDNNDDESDDFDVYDDEEE